MKIELAKKQARLLFACVVEIDQAEFWYNPDAMAPIGKTFEGQKAVSELANILHDQVGFLDEDDPIYQKYLVELRIQKERQ